MTVSHSRQFDYVDRLARKLQVLAKHKAPNERVLVGLSGIPGSGKSPLAAAIAARVNQLQNENEHEDANTNPSTTTTSINLALCVPMDGSHLTRAQLAGMPDPATAIRRRGPPFIFDAEAFYNLVLPLRKTSSSSKNLRPLLQPRPQKTPCQTTSPYPHPL
ncbi:uncharacterized protein BDV17DRAFT_294129 [Aspergillus undulatus]|uniref:uncharacterized protein n=1 Tax=Aspergillus undulatus TaxID=1810928 RepID=UPI003CCD1A40